jgi:hypothetical protein
MKGVQSEEWAIRKPKGSVEQNGQVITAGRWYGFFEHGNALYMLLAHPVFLEVLTRKILTAEGVSYYCRQAM